MSTFAKRMRMSDEHKPSHVVSSAVENHADAIDDGVHRTGATFSVPGALACHMHAGERSLRIADEKTSPFQSINVSAWR